MRTQTHDGLPVGSFTILPDGKLKCSQGHVGAMRVFTMTQKPKSAPEFKCQSCSETGLAFNHASSTPLSIVPF